MRELTGYDDKHGRPILEGDIVVSHAGEINVVEEIPEGWFPLCFFEEHEIATIEVIGSAYTVCGNDSRFFGPQTGRSHPAGLA